MTVSVIIMIIVGICFVIASYFITEKINSKEDDKAIDYFTINEEYEFSERELQIIKRKIEDVIAKQAKDILYETNESLSNMANEKTMALGDYAVAVCDEIEKNHKEVMFLYSMLDDKQKEIMRTVKDVDSEKQYVSQMLDEIEKLKVDTEKTVSNEQDEIYVSPTANNEESISHNEADFDEQTENRIEDELDNIFEEIDKTDIDFDEVLDEDFKEDANANDIILEMFQNGNSVIEIAKQLGLGVGEVKLVIDLYQGD